MYTTVTLIVINNNLIFKYSLKNLRLKMSLLNIIDYIYEKKLE